MAEPFLSEIRIFSFNFPPKNWAFCNNQLLPINQNQALFSLLGTTYGGNGQTNFALPDLRGRVPMSFGGGYTLGERAGAAAVTIDQSTTPQHFHVMQGTTAAATTNIPTGNLLGSVSSSLYIAPTQPTAMRPTSLTTVGGTQPHNNMSPYLALNFCIALAGIFPSQN